MTDIAALTMELERDHDGCTFQLELRKQHSMNAVSNFLDEIRQQNKKDVAANSKLSKLDIQLNTDRLTVDFVGSDGKKENLYDSRLGLCQVAVEPGAGAGASLINSVMRTWGMPTEDKIDPTKGGKLTVRKGEGYIRAIRRAEPGLSPEKLQQLAAETEKRNQNAVLQPGDVLFVPPLKA